MPPERRVPRRSAVEAMQVEACAVPLSHCPPREVSELAVFRAVLAKNWALKWRGFICCCSALEILVPLIFLGLLCIPRYLIADTSHPARFYAPANLTDLAWSSRPPSDGAFQLYYVPSTSATATQVAEMAAKELVCSSPSVMRQVAIAGSFYVDTAGIAAAGMTTTCAANPAACAGYLRRRSGGLPATAALITGNLRTLCAPSCLASRACFGPLLAEFLRGFPTEDAAVAAAAAAAPGTSSAGGGVAAMLVLPADFSAGDDVTYTLRTNASDVPNARQLGPRWAREGFDPWVVAPQPAWRAHWFLSNLQRATDAAIISLKTQRTPQEAALLRLGGVADVFLNTQVKQYPYNAYSTNLGASFAALFFGLCFVFAFLTTVVLILKSMVMEKELRIREGMLMMGLRGRVYWLSWFVTHYATLTLIATLMALVGTYPFHNTNGFIMWIFYMTWMGSLVCFCYALSTLFSTSKIAAVAGALLYILTWAPAVAVTSGDGAHGSSMWTLVCIFPASSIYQWGLAVALLENAEEGVKWHTLFRNLIDGGAGSGTFSAGGVLLVTALSGTCSAFWCWYLDKAAPREFGTRLPWWFPFSRAFWRDGHCGADAAVAANADVAPPPARQLLPAGAPAEAEEDEEAASALLAGAVESVPPERAATASVVLRRLSKWFAGASRGDSRVLAVDNLSVSFYEGEITALLGHNGAGKTTTLSMLSGMLPPSAGAASVGGLDLRTRLVDVRRRLGVCPQHDVLWPTLSCAEHLALYAAFRGVPRATVAAEAARVLAEVGLAEKAAAPAGTLSGGQRRKLSLAIAFVGGPAVVYLDEPTSGMDPFSRRFAWGYIRSQKPGRTIVLTTHFMDEADLLSDRIAIMTRGRLAACGSPLFLKSRLGLGHHLSLLLAPSADGNDGAHSASALAALLEQHAPGSVCEAHVGAELSFLLPPGAAAAFPPLLRELDARRAELRVASYAVSCSTLEEVFLSIAEHASGNDASGSADSSVAKRLTAEGLRDAATARKRAAAEVRRAAAAAAEAAPGKSSANAFAASDDAPLVEGWALVAQQFGALMRKRALNARRDRLAWATQYAVPVAFVALGLALSHVSASAGSYPSALLGPAFLANKPMAAAAAPGAAASAAQFSVSFGAPGLSWVRQADSVWNCSAPSSGSPSALAAAAAAMGVTSSAALQCEPDVSDCAALGCTPAGAATAATLDAALLSASEAHKNCRQSVHASCAAVFVEQPGGARRFALTLAASPDAFHALPAAQSAADSAVYSTLLGRPARIAVVAHPLPDPAGGRASSNSLVLNLLVGLCVVLALGSLSASAAVFLVAERRGHSKHLQMVSGVHRATFWAATAAWDALNYLLPLTAFMVAFGIARVPAYSDDGALAVIFVALLLFGCAAHPLAYLLHYPFANEMNALAAQMGIYLFFGVAQLIAAAVLRGLAALGKAQDAWTVLRQLFRWLPHYNVGAILFNLTQNAALPIDTRASPWAHDVAGNELAALAAEAAIYAFLTLAVEFDAAGECARLGARVARRMARAAGIAHLHVSSGAGAEDDDADVAAERRRIEAAGGDAGDIVTLRALRKTYRGGKVAVKALTLGVAEGHCFGLLGVNGAGKSTTFKMLTGEVAPSSGDALVRGRAGGAAGAQPFNVVSQLSSVRQRLGLCPQDDGLAARLTGREHLRFYAAIRGVPPVAAAALADALLQRLGLARWADRPAGTYSGGNKRKLSVAISLVGEPPCCLLDEPSSGVDPESRRGMWAVLAASMPGRAMVLTTHSLDEAEALCTRMGIMVGGRLRCLGSVAHLKATHGGGHTLELRAPAEAAGRVAAFLAQALPAAALAEEHAGRLTYSVPRGAGAPALADVFEVAQRARTELGVFDFSLTQCSLEQIFVAFAAQQEEERGAPVGMLPRRSTNAALAGATVLEMGPLPPPPPPPVRCPGCDALLRWVTGASVMRCGACDALVGLPPSSA